MPVSNKPVSVPVLRLIGSGRAHDSVPMPSRRPRSPAFRVMAMLALLLVGITFGAVRSVAATPCVAGPVFGFLPDPMSGMPPPVCTIGNTTYLFDSFDGVGLTAFDVILTPDASDPFAPGFVLTRDVSGFFAASAGNFEQASLGYFAHVTDPMAGPQLAGTTIAAIDYSIHLMSGAGSSRAPSVTALSTLRGTGVCQVFALAGERGDVTPTSIILQDLGSPHTTSLPTGCGGGGVNAFATVTADGGDSDTTAVVTLRSAGFYLNQSRMTSTDVPTPASCALLSLGLFSSLMRRRRVIPRASRPAARRSCRD